MIERVGGGESGPLPPFFDDNQCLRVEGVDCWHSCEVGDDEGYSGHLGREGGIEDGAGKKSGVHT